MMEQASTQKSEDLQSIVIVSQGRPPLGRYLSEAFSRKGIKATVFSTDQNTWFDKYVIHTLNKQLHNLRLLSKERSLFVDHSWGHRNYLNAKLRQLLAKEQPDMILAIRGATYGDAAIEQSTAIRCGWWVEPGSRTHELFDELKNYDWYYSMNNESLDRLNDHGYKSCSYMPHMYSQTEFYPIEGLEKKHDLVFVGTWSPRRQRYISAAMEVTDNVVLYGRGWLVRNWKNLKYWRSWKGLLIQGSKLNRLYNQSKVVLNVTQWGTEANQQASGMNMRFFEVPAAGALLMTDEVEEAGSIFQPQKDFSTFGDVDDFMAQLRNILNDGPKIERMAKSGYESLTKANASYDRFVDELIQRYARVISTRNMKA